MDKTQIETLEEKGAEAVLHEMAKGLHGDPGSRLRHEIESWLRAKEVAASFASSSKRDAREEETLKIARRATNNSLIATIIAAIAMICSVISIFIKSP